jgi:uncharacterized protein YbaR (Trm112 family)
MIAAEVLALLRCPETQQPLALAPAELVAQVEAARSAGWLRNRAGNPSDMPIEGGLVRADEVLFFPICDGIPVLIASEAVVLPLAAK